MAFSFICIRRIQRFVAVEGRDMPMLTLFSLFWKPEGKTGDTWSADELCAPFGEDMVACHNIVDVNPHKNFPVATCDRQQFKAQYLLYTMQWYQIDYTFL